MYQYSAADLDYFNSVLQGARGRFAELPEPLPWMEPSINIPFLQACASYVFGQSYGSILLTGATLDHALRLAIIDFEAGSAHSMRRDLWDDVGPLTLGQLFKKTAAINALIPSDPDRV